MKWSTDITVEKLRQIADDVESGAVSVKSVEYKASNCYSGNGIDAEIKISFLEPSKKSEERSTGI